MLSDKPIPSKVRTRHPHGDRAEGYRQSAYHHPEPGKIRFILPDMGVKVAFGRMSSQRQGQEQSRAASGSVHPKGAVRSDADASFVFWFAMEESQRPQREPRMDRGTDVAILAASPLATRWSSKGQKVCMMVTKLNRQ